MKTLKNIPFTIEKTSLALRLMIEPESDDAHDFADLVQLALKNGRPVAAYSEKFIDSKNDNGVVIGGVEFNSKTLRHNLDAVERVFPFVATCGVEMDKVFPPGSDILKDYWWDAIKMQLVTAARSFLQKHLSTKYRLGKTACMSPGSGDANIWPITQQRQLFSLLGDVHGAIGVELTDTCLMIPNKTVSGLMFTSEVNFQGCEVCHRENCPGRRAEFNPELWSKIS